MRPRSRSRARRTSRTPLKPAARIARFTSCAPGIGAGVAELDEPLEDNFASRCEVCGAALTEAEIAEAREAGRSFVCGLHAAELLPAEELGLADDAAP